MDMWYYIMSPFTWLLKFFCELFNSYGLALLLFALVVKVLLFPLSLKGKKGMIQMNMLNGKLQKLQKQYGKDKNRYNEEVQKLYAKENVNPMGGCLWSFLPLLILLPLYAIIRQPLKYMMGMTAEQISAVAQTLNWSTVALENGWIRAAATEFTNVGYNQLYLASLIKPENIAQIQSVVGETLGGVSSINFNFFGADLSQIPRLRFWANGLAGFGLFMFPVISAITGLLFSVVSMRTNSMNNQNAQAAQTNRTMMLITPLMSLWIGFSMPAALSVYWVANNVLGMLQELVSGQLLKKDYAKAAEEARQREIDEKEEEKRLRREKAEQKAREAEEARKNKGKKKEKDPDEEKMTPEQRDASRVGMRQYARGRAYDPNRYGGVTPYYEDVLKKKAAQAEDQPKEEEKPLPEAEPQKEAPAQPPVEETQALPVDEPQEEAAQAEEPQDE